MVSSEGGLVVQADGSSGDGRLAVQVDGRGGWQWWWAAAVQMDRSGGGLAAEAGRVSCGGGDGGRQIMSWWDCAPSLSTPIIIFCSLNFNKMNIENKHF